MAIPSTTVISAAVPPAMKLAITWWPDPTGRARPRRASRRCFIPPRNSPWRATAPSYSTRKTCRTWSRFNPVTKCSHSLPIFTNPRRPPITAAMVKTNFFQYLDFVLQFAPPGPEEMAIRAKLARIGIGAGKTFDFGDLDLEHKLEVGIGMKDGDKKIDVYLASGIKDVNGWKIGSWFGDRSFYDGNWLKRAAAAKGGIYGNDSVEATYPMTKTLVDGEVLDGSKHNYMLTFLAGQLPPVNAFWSVTMYDGKTQFLIKNPINRYLINSPMLPGMKKNDDGSLTLYIQKDSPGADKESNWLPAPNDTIYLVMRLYWPRTEAPSILPAGEGTWQPPAIVKVN